jgi:hypothetical protein
LLLSSPALAGRNAPPDTSGRGGFSGAIYTTDSTGTIVNQNHYANTTNVYLNGGPQNNNSSGLPDGTYYFQVTDPSGATLLSTDDARCRQLIVINGRVFGPAGPCPHAAGAFNPANNSETVQLAPFAQTPDSGGVYKAWLIRQTGTTSISTTDPKVILFARSNAKTDNFKVASGTPPPPPPPPSGACLAASSMSVLIQGSNVIAYVPRGSWIEFTPGIKVVTLEGVGPSPTIIPTPNVVNSCASNGLTGETVCTSNGTDVYLITGTTLNTTVSSGATASQSFSGGTCMTCGVAMDPSANQAVLAIGLASGGPGGYQFIDLGTSTAGTVVPAGAPTSEDIFVDLHHRVLSPNELGNYQIMDSTLAVFNNTTNPPSLHDLDSGCEDCLTGIALATDEFTQNLFLADLNQATFAAGNWSTPPSGSNLQNFPEFSGFVAGTSGIAIAPGSHLGIVTGEFGGSSFGVIQLPSTAGGTPTVVDWVSASVPSDSSGAPWQMGFDPHTVTAYVSPSTHKAIGVMCNQSRSLLALVDLQCLLSGPRVGHVSSAPGCITFVALPGPFPGPADGEEPIVVGPRGKNTPPRGNPPGSGSGQPSSAVGDGPSSFHLSRAVPNQLRTSASVAYSLPEASHARLAVHDVTGRLVKVLVDQDLGRGNHTAVWDGTDANGSGVRFGVYFCTLTAGTRSATQRVVMGR